MKVLSPPLQAIEDEDDEQEEEDLDENSELSKEQRVLVQKLKRKLKTYKKSYEKQLEKIPSEDKIAELNKHAQLLQSYGYMVQDGDYELELIAEISGQDQDLRIALDPEKSLGANIEDYFVRSKKAKKSREMGFADRRK